MVEFDEQRELSVFKSEKANNQMILDLDKERFAKRLLSGYGDTIGVMNGYEGKKIKIPFSWKVKRFLKRLFGIEKKEKELIVQDITNEIIK